MTRASVVVDRGRFDCVRDAVGEALRLARLELPRGSSAAVEVRAGDRGRIEARAVQRSGGERRRT